MGFQKRNNFIRFPSDSCRRANYLRKPLNIGLVYSIGEMCGIDQDDNPVSRSNLREQQSGRWSPTAGTEFLCRIATKHENIIFLNLYPFPLRAIILKML